MKRYYEAHITLEADRGDRHRVRRLVEEIGWKYSCIDGDPVMGPGVKMYATKHWNPKIGDEEAVRRLHEAATMLMTLSEKDGEVANVTRRKIELVLYDDRSSKVRLGACNGACPECHLDDLAKT